MVRQVTIVAAVGSFHYGHWLLAAAAIQVLMVANDVIREETR